jgi:hypothetical protein
MVKPHEAEPKVSGIIATPRRFLRDILTDYDGRTYDTGRSLAVFVVTAMTAMQAWAVFKGNTFNPTEYGTGVAAIIASLGVAIFGDNAKRPEDSFGDVVNSGERDKK